MNEQAFLQQVLRTLGPDRPLVLINAQQIHGWRNEGDDLVFELRIPMAAQFPVVIQHSVLIQADPFMGRWPTWGPRGANDASRSS